MNRQKTKKCRDGELRDFLQEKGILEEVQARALKQTLNFSKDKKLTKISRVAK